MPTYVIAYRAPANYQPDEAADTAAWAAWFQSLGDKLIDFGKPVYGTAQIGDCGATQRFRGYSVVAADDFDSAVAMAEGCPGLADDTFGVEVGVARELPG